MDVDTSVTLLRDLPDSVSPTADNGSDHVTLDEQSQWKVGLSSWSWHTGVRCTTASASAFVNGFDVQTISSEVDAI